MDEFDFLKSSTTCRICLQINLNPLKSLFESFQEDQELAELYKYCTGFIVLPLDSYTTSICTNCESSLISCFEFRKQCEKSEEIISSSLSDAIKSENIENFNSYLEHDQEITKTRLDKEESSGFLDEFEVIKRVKCEIEDAGDLEYANHEMEASDEEPEDELIPINGMYLCKYCGKTYKKDFLLESHIERHHSQQTKDTRKKDESKCTGGKRKCKASSGKSSKSRKIMSKTEETEFVATFSCKSRSKVKKESKCDVKYEELPKAKKMTEEEIVASFSKQEKPREAPVQQLCLHCGKMASKFHCLKHEKEVQAARDGIPEEDKSVSCEICGKKFKNKYYLRPHLMQHNNESRYKCEHCGENFVQWSSWKSHVAVKHTGEKKYHCMLCDERFFYSGQLTIHRRKHTGELPFECTWPECDMKFITSKQLKYHMVSHTNQRNHVCEFCSASFIERSGLKRHMNSHTGEKRNPPKSHQHLDFPQAGPSQKITIDQQNVQYPPYENLGFTTYNQI